MLMSFLVKFRISKWETSEIRIIDIFVYIFKYEKFIRCVDLKR